MPIKYETDQWLKDAGYEYHCFISWAHTTNKIYSGCAARMKQEMEEILGLYIPNPRIFFDDEAIFDGDYWENTLRNGLCKSVVMIALCAPIYFTPEHEWCGREWAAMTNLTDIRLPGAGFSAIIPVLFRRPTMLPKQVSQIQYIDLTQLLLRGPHYYNTREFREYVNRIGRHIARVAEELADHTIPPDCGHFEIPTESPFSAFSKPKERRPFGGTS